MLWFVILYTIKAWLIMGSLENDVTYYNPPIYNLFKLYIYIYIYLFLFINHLRGDFFVKKYFLMGPHGWLYLYTYTFLIFLNFFSVGDNSDV